VLECFSGLHFAQVDKYKSFFLGAKLRVRYLCSPLFEMVVNGRAKK